MTTRRALSRIAAVLGWSCAATLALAHPGRHHDIERVTARIHAEPARADLYLERAVYYRLDAQYDLALADLDTSRRLDPAAIAVAVERGLTLAALGRDAEAEPELTRYIEQGPPSSAALAQRARLRTRAGQSAAALEDYTASLRIEPDVDLFLERGRLQEEEALWVQASEGYREALARIGGATNLRLALVRTELAAGRPAEALQVIEDGMARLPIKTDWLLRKADVLEAMGRPDEARAQREAALAEADRVLGERATGIHLVSRARALLALGRPESASIDLEAALAKSPQFTEARELLARIQGTHGEARTQR